MCVCVCVRVYVSVCATDPFNAPDLLMFVGFPSAKDPTFHERYAREHNQHCPLTPTPACLTPHAATTVPSFPNKSTCVVISEIEPRWFDAWRGYASGKRPADYKAVKQRFKDRIMARLLKLYPQLEGKVECVAGRGGTCGVRHVMHVLTSGHRHRCLNLNAATSISQPLCPTSSTSAARIRTCRSLCWWCLRWLYGEMWR